MQSFYYKHGQYVLYVNTCCRLLSTFSKSKELRGVVREIPFEPNKKKQYLEIWKHRQLWKTFDLSALEVHGDVYCDSKHL
jgi:acylaminoacyl-peptidase